MSIISKINVVHFVVLGVGISLGVLIHYLLTPTVQSPNVKEIRNSFNYKYINPLLECDGFNVGDSKNYNTLKRNIQTIIDTQINNHKISFASVYYRDLNNGPWFGINEKEYFSPASLVKVPVMIAYYKLAETDPLILQKKLVNTRPYDPKEQNIVPEVSLAVNQEYTIEELIRRMIVYSDNLAYDLLLDNIDNQKIFNVYRDLGADISKASEDPNGNIITVTDYASFLRILFNSSYLDKDSSEKALKLLSEVAYKNGLVAGVPKNVLVAHKFGERQYMGTGEKQLHDCGIVYEPQKPYLLCIMTRGNNFENDAALIRSISSTVYKQISSSKN
jgi:beta-lactamase class A